MMDVKVVLFRSKDDCSETLALTLPQTATVRKLRDSVDSCMQDGKRCGDEELVSAVSEDGKGLVAFLRNGKSKEQKKKSTSESQASQAVTQPQQADPKTVSALILSWLTNVAPPGTGAARSAKRGAVLTWRMVRGFADLGVVSEAELWALDQGQIKGCVSHGGQRKKILAALQRGKVEPKAAKKRRGAFDDASEPEEAVEPPAERKPQACTGVVLINRSPVMILWAAILAKEALGYDWAEALSLGSAVSALNARAKHDRIWGTKHSSAAASFGGEGAPVDDVQLLGRPVPACRTAAGIRGLVSEQAVQPRSVAKSLRLAFAGHALETVYSAMLSLARIAAQAVRADSRLGYALYERFRPLIADGAAGWGKAGELDLDLIRRIGDEYAAREGGGEETEGKEAVAVKEEDAGGGGGGEGRRGGEEGGGAKVEVKAEVT